MADKVQFELVSPEKLLLSEAVDMVVVPGSEGNFGVLAGHSLLISTVRPGVIDVYEGSEISERIFVSGGFAEVTAERCTVLADEAVPLSSLDAVAVEAELRTIEAALANLRDRAGRLSGDEREQAEIEQRATELKLDIETAKLAALRQGAPHQASIGARGEDGERAAAFCNIPMLRLCYPALGWLKKEPFDGLVDT